jgi:hypothetical protein
MLDIYVIIRRGFGKQILKIGQNFYFHIQQSVHKQTYSPHRQDSNMDRLIEVRAKPGI